MAEQKPDAQPPEPSRHEPMAAQERPLPPHSETAAESEKQPVVEHPDGKIEHPWVSHEQRDASFKGVFIVMVATIALGALEFFLVHVFFSSQEGAQSKEKKSPFPLAQTPSEKPPAAPRLEQIDRSRGLRESAYSIEAPLERTLHRYGDSSEAGFVHIPIEQAIKLVAPELKVRTSRPKGVARDNGLVDGGESNSGRLLRKEPRW